MSIEFCPFCKEAILTKPYPILVDGIEIPSCVICFINDHLEQTGRGGETKYGGGENRVSEVPV